MTIQDPEARRLLAEINSTWSRLVDRIEAIANNMEERAETELSQDNSHSALAPCASHPHGAPLPHFMLQDIDSSRDDYSRGLSGRI